MDLNSFEKIIGFAIKKEEEAIKFYSDLREKVKDQASKKLLEELEAMELGHKKILQNLDISKIESYNREEITNLGISEVMNEIEINPLSTFQEVLIVAMKREEQAQKLYTNLSNHISDEAVKKVFLKLADEEAKHKLMLERLYDDEVLREN